MPKTFTLEITTNFPQILVQLKLYDSGQGEYLAGQQIRLSDYPAKQLESLFDTRNYVERHADSVCLEDLCEPSSEKELLHHLGVFLGENILGHKIMEHIYVGIEERTLLLHIPSIETDVLAAAFARVPWEMACLENSRETLFQRNLVVRTITHAENPLKEKKVSIKDAVHVLLIFPETLDASPLSSRLERKELLELFRSHILPKSCVEVDFLSHNVTREAIEEQIRKKGGYHIIHWSGHGHHKTLKVADEDGKSDVLSEKDLVDLFKNAGGFIPDLIFLSACHSGTFIDVKDVENLEAYLKSNSQVSEETPSPELNHLLEQNTGYTGTALELLNIGRPQVVAMRYAVSDTYTRRLAQYFYKHLLVDPAHHTVDRALALARKDVIKEKEHSDVDHATALLFAEERLSFEVNKGQSMQLESWYPLPLLKEDSDFYPPENFIGRNEELSTLAQEWLPHRYDKSTSSVAIIHGEPGLGKTTLVAEAINIWHQHFQWVFTFQSYPDALSVKSFYKKLDQDLFRLSPSYRNRCANNDHSRIYLSNKIYSGQERYQYMRANLIDVLSVEPMLLVFDHFETHLYKHSDELGYCFRDPEWEYLLKELSCLSRASSRILITSRRHITAIKDEVLSITIKAFTLPTQIQLFIQSNNYLRQFWLNNKISHSNLVSRILDISYGHPIILKHLGDLASDFSLLKKELHEKSFEIYRDELLGDFFNEVNIGDSGVAIKDIALSSEMELQREDEGDFEFDFSDEDDPEFDFSDEDDPDFDFFGDEEFSERDDNSKKKLKEFQKDIYRTFDYLGIDSFSSYKRLSKQERLQINMEILGKMIGLGGNPRELLEINHVNTQFKRNLLTPKFYSENKNPWDVLHRKTAVYANHSIIPITPIRQYHDVSTAAKDKTINDNTINLLLQHRSLIELGKMSVVPAVVKTVDNNYKEQTVFNIDKLDTMKVDLKNEHLKEYFFKEGKLLKPTGTMIFNSPNSGGLVLEDIMNIIEGHYPEEYNFFQKHLKDLMFKINPEDHTQALRHGLNAIDEAIKELDDKYKNAKRKSKYSIATAATSGALAVGLYSMNAEVMSFVSAAFASSPLSSLVSFIPDSEPIPEDIKKSPFFIPWFIHHQSQY